MVEAFAGNHFNMRGLLLVKALVLAMCINCIAGVSMDAIAKVKPGGYTYPPELQRMIDREIERRGRDWWEKFLENMLWADQRGELLPLPAVETDFGTDLGGKIKFGWFKDPVPDGFELATSTPYGMQRVRELVNQWTQGSVFQDPAVAEMRGRRVAGPAPSRVILPSHRANVFHAIQQSSPTEVGGFMEFDEGGLLESSAILFSGGSKTSLLMKGENHGVSWHTHPHTTTRLYNPPSEDDLSETLTQQLDDIRDDNVVFTDEGAYAYRASEGLLHCCAVYLESRTEYSFMSSIRGKTHRQKIAERPPPGVKCSPKFTCASMNLKFSVQEIRHLLVGLQPEGGEAAGYFHPQITRNLAIDAITDMGFDVDFYALPFERDIVMYSREVGGQKSRLREMLCRNGAVNVA